MSPETRAAIATYRAEARFIRALAYYHGLDLFGNIRDSLPFLKKKPAS